MRGTMLWLALLAPLAARAEGQAQASEEQINVVAEALRALRAQERSGPTAIVPAHAHNAPANNEALTAALAKRLGYEADPKDAATVVTYRVTGVRLSGDKATVIVESFPRLSSIGGSYLVTWSVALTRSGGRWVANKTTVVGTR